ncbi:MAG: (2Fe-2S) ferredoxin domain-containing protein [Candidatus Magasanikbacteria bacterium]|nr:(2Fe-2S) ferredoxin domain-containing protein [Candidatus Magasanikbacteria bacterium]
MSKKIRVCQGPHCRYRGAERIMEVLAAHFGLAAGQKNEPVDLDFCACVDNCDSGPNVVEDDSKLYQEAATKDITKRLEQGAGQPITPLTIDDLKLDEL